MILAYLDYFFNLYYNLFGDFMFDNDIFMLILSIIYIICVFIEIKVLKRNNIDIFYKENFLLILISSTVLPLAIFSVFFGYHAIKDMSCVNKFNIVLCGYFFTFMLASLAYVIRYVKTKIYAFISPENKLSFFEFKNIYDKN